MHVRHAYLPLLRCRSSRSTPCASKAAVTTLTTRYAREPKDVKVNAAGPGQAATEVTGGPGHSVSAGAEFLVTLATIGPDGPTGQFIDRSRKPPVHLTRAPGRLPR
ncbi:short chain oxidoreductase [Streptomyces canus]|uniref:short chain oxidoreductase n=1 Tax=Streptomyces canus TaxID=58343 RepID=UPI0033BB02E5